MLSQSSKSPEIYKQESRKTNPETKNFSEKAVFSRLKFSENSTERFFSQPLGHMDNNEMLRVSRGHTRVNFPGDEGRSKLSQNAKTNEKNCSTSKEYLGQTTYLRPSVPLKALNCFSRQSSGYHEAQLTYIVCAKEKSFQMSRQRLRKPTFWHLLAKNPLKKVAHCRNLHQNFLLYTLFKRLLNSSVTHYFEACSTR